ncbi:MAG: signal recognition particle-docking protein FtsY [Desulfovibrio sp.]|nr:signal recognition particle-docking protein FtsY [Desulfovibrio sp.]
MAFFSKIKRLWSKEQPAEAVPADVIPADVVSADVVSADAPEAVGAAPAPEPGSQPLHAVEDTFEFSSDTPEVKAQPEQPAWQAALALALRQAEPRLSVWLSLILEGHEKASPELWDRLAFLFQALEAPEAEARAFIASFTKWLDDMEYVRVKDFRSELQYRLALALELEDEEDERSRLFIKLSESIQKTREQLTRQLNVLFTSHDALTEAFWEELEEVLIMADVGVEAATTLTTALKERARAQGVTDPAAMRGLLQEELKDIFTPPKTIKAVNPPEVVLIIGVNGVGKTTTIAKLAHRGVLQGRRVLIAAGDTFRAAAVEQLRIWSQRTGAGFFAKGQNADPAAVAFEAVDHCLKERYDLLIVDTAGRLHTKVDLMEELKKIKRVLGKKHPGAPHRSVLVLDATTGQNALSQTRLFHQGVGVDEIILTKLDGTAKGGVVVAIASLFKLPITFVGLGEKMEDLRPFHGEDFIKALLE